MAAYEITADMIERGRDGDPRRVAERRRITRRVREAREKLTAGNAPRDFGADLLRLYAERRKTAAPAALVVAVALALVAAHWVNVRAVAAWLGVNLLCTLLAYVAARRFLARPATEAASVRTWSRLFLVGETLHGLVWASIVPLAGYGVGSGAPAPQLSTFALIGMLLVAAMNATVTASIPRAVYGTLMPMAAAIIVAFRPRSLQDGDLLLVMLALGALLYFVYLARKLYRSSLQALAYQADKDDLIAELEQAKANSDLARRRAEESNLAKSQFLATMSHELRTPLNAILGFSEVMKSELFGQHAVSAYRGYSHDIHASGEHLLILINEILDLSRVEAGRYELHEEAVDLAGIIEDCRRLMALRAKKKDITIDAMPTPALPRLWADARAVRQVALNLLSNAIKFTPQGGRVSIEIGLADDDGQFFAIRDTGPGIPESEIPVVMSPFGRGVLAQKHAEEGSGLGLPIVRGLVELHGGSFELRSKVREGTAVTVRFPPERGISALAAHDPEDDPVFPGFPPRLRPAA